jgi:pyruvate dehydrogenase kinase 2/3/4
LTETFNTSQRSKKSQKSDPRADRNSDFVGEVFLKCNAKDVVERCGKFTQELMRQSSGSNKIPEINIKGHLDATFPYILGHLEYIIGELLRNSIQAVMEKYRDSTADPPPIEVLICEASQYVTLRISDRGGGVPREIFPTLWSFSKGPRTQDRLENLGQVPTLAATMQELEVPLEMEPSIKGSYREGSLSTLSSRPPNLRLGMGLPMSRVYAEYWAGSLELHSLEGYGVDAFLQISKLGNKNEQVTARASVDAV